MILNVTHYIAIALPHVKTGAAVNPAHSDSPPSNSSSGDMDTVKPAIEWDITK